MSAFGSVRSSLRAYVAGEGLPLPRQTLKPHGTRQPSNSKYNTTNCSPRFLFSTWTRPASPSKEPLFEGAALLQRRQIDYGPQDGPPTYLMSASRVCKAARRRVRISERVGQW